MGILTKFLTTVLLLLLLPSSNSLASASGAEEETTRPTTTTNNMNKGGHYMIANSDTYDTTTSLYHNNHEYFEVYSPPIKTRYSEVYWRMQDPVPLPDDVVERFADNKIMAVTGYEVDQVRLTNDGKEMSVPITWAYNHHYGAFLSNTKKTKLVKRTAETPDRMYVNHNREEYWTAEFITDDSKNEDDAMNGNNSDDDDDNSEIALSIFFSEGNGGEFRQSYHGYPSGYAQLIESPDTFSCQPMQIDTWNREEDTSKFRPGGALPKSSRIPSSAGYSGLIECPCSDRMEKEWSMTYALDVDDTSFNNNDESPPCTGEIQDATECFLGATKAVQAPKHVHRTVSEPSRPHGCTVKQSSDGTVEAIWNTSSNTTPISHQDHAPLIAFSNEQVDVMVKLNGEEVTITLVGPLDRWFGVAFGSSSMCIHMIADECPDGGPYAIVVSEDDYHVTERKLGFHGPGSILEKSVTVVSNSVVDGNRTVVVTRSLQGATVNHFSFDPSKTTIPIIAARGCSPEFAQHCGHGPSQLNFLAVDSPTRICQAGISGTIDGVKFDNRRCAPSPKSDLITQQNPTCSVQTYRGGLSCCSDGKPLLDQDQEIPWAEQYLEYRLKFRFYFQEYQPPSVDRALPSHQSLIRLYWQTESWAGEYDIEQCPKGTPTDQCVQVITSRWKVHDMMRDCSLRPDASWCTGIGSADRNKTEGVELIYAAPHCHAPTCLSMDLYNADTGQLLCHVEPVFGQGSDKPYDEHGFLAIPPCLWGDAKEGLTSPPRLTLDTTLLSIKRNNNTLPHTGEMASWQMRGVLVPKTRTTTLSLPDSLLETDASFSDKERRGQLRHGS